METEQDKKSIYWVILFQKETELIVSSRNQNNSGFWSATSGLSWSGGSDMYVSLCDYYVTTMK